MTHSGKTTRRGFIRVQRHAHWHEVGGGAATPQERWIVLHGYGQRSGHFLRRFTPIAGPERLIVAPEGLSRYYLDDRFKRVGASWMTRDDRDGEIVDTHDWLDALVAHLDERDGKPARTVVLGFSQGAPTAGRWVLDRRNDVDQLICWCAGLPTDVELTPLQASGVELKFVVGRSDSIVPKEVIDREFERVRAASIEFEIIEFDGGHEIISSVLEQVVGGD